MITIQIILELLYATLLGALIGVEREIKGKDAGFQTYALVALGACLFTIIFANLSSNFPETSFDPGRIIQAIAIGVGFLGAGTIFKEGSGVKGLTTAAGLWVVSAIGISVAVQEYFTALISTVIVVFIFVLLGTFERKITKAKK